MKKTSLKIVLGLGVTGLSVINYLVQQGEHVAVIDTRENPPNAHDVPQGVQTVFGALDEELLLQAHTIIISPGLSRETPSIVKAIEKGIPVIGDIDLLARALQAMPKPIPLVAITGSNAKSTVTTLVGEMAKNAGIKVAVGGNLGRPALDLLADEPELIILEVSSFQLESTTNLAPTVATILNVSPDHLDRHHDMAGYTTAKQRVFEGACSVVTNRDDPLTLPNIDNKYLNIVSFGSDSPNNDNYGMVNDNNVMWITKSNKKLISSTELKVKGIHNLLNVQSALALGEIVGIPMSAMLETLKEFRGLAHRCEFVDTINGVDYFNDSKGTNVGSTLAAINGLGESYQSTANHKKLYVILGGEGKGQDFSPLTPALKQFVKVVLLVGNDANIIAQHSHHTVETHHVESIDKAVAFAKEYAQTGDVVLLSPACASFDQFTNYMTRGEYFVKEVQRHIH